VPAEDWPAGRPAEEHRDRAQGAWPAEGSHGLLGRRQGRTEGWLGWPESSGGSQQEHRKQRKAN